MLAAGAGAADAAVRTGEGTAALRRPGFACRPSTVTCEISISAGDPGGAVEAAAFGGVDGDGAASPEGCGEELFAAPGCGDGEAPGATDGGDCAGGGAGWAAEIPLRPITAIDVLQRRTERTTRRGIPRNSIPDLSL